MTRTRRFVADHWAQILTAVAAALLSAAAVSGMVGADRHGLAVRGNSDLAHGFILLLSG